MPIVCFNGWGGNLQDRLIPARKTSCAPRKLAKLADLPRRRPRLSAAGHLLPRFRRSEAHHAVICRPAAQGVLWTKTSKSLARGLATFVHISLRIIASANRSCSRHSHQTGKVICRGSDPYTPPPPRLCAQRARRYRPHARIARPCRKKAIPRKEWCRPTA